MVRMRRYGYLFLLSLVFFASADDRTQEFNSGNPLHRARRSVAVIRNLFQPSLSVEYKVPGKAAPEMCHACEQIVNLLLGLLKDNTDKEIELMLYNLCVGMDIMAEPVCKGITSIFTPELGYILRHKEMRADAFCSIAMQRFGCHDPNAMNWTLETPLGERPQNPQGSRSGGRRVVKVMHLTDLHLQPEYSVGSNANCGNYVCCRPDQGPPDTPGDAAGYWGDYRDCDMPYHSLDELLKHAGTHHPDVSMVLMTGDLPSHVVWETSREGNLDILANMTALIKQHFPKTPVYPVLGNHESHPVNCYPPRTVEDPSMGSSWLFNAASSSWSQWLSPQANESLRRRGYYWMQARPGLRVVVMNNNVAYVYNWWLLYDLQEPKEQLEWLAQQLLDAEAAGDRVLLLGHVPPGTENFWALWNREFARIVDRFQYTIVAQWYGHLHTDEFRLFYDIKDPRKATNVAFVGGSATTYSFLNPNYKIFHLDADTWDLLDQETWFYNLTEANVKGQPRWRLLYTSREAFGLNSLHPQELAKLVTRFLKDRPLLDKYHRYMVKDSDPLLTEECGPICRRSLLCNMRLADSSDLSHCHGVVKELDLMESLGDLDKYDVSTEQTGNSVDHDHDHDHDHNHVHEQLQVSESSRISLPLISSVILFSLLCRFF